MYQPVDDHAKRRLTESRDIAVALRILTAEGVPAEDLLSEITKLFYVDLDAFNEVLVEGSRDGASRAGRGSVAPALHDPRAGLQAW